MNEARIAIAIPALNAESSIAQVASDSLALRLGPVLVVDDGSDDATAVRAMDAGADVIRHPKNLGKGAALRTAFKELFSAGHSAVITLDADGQHLASEVSKLMHGWSEEADLVIGVREQHFRQMAGVRRWSNRMSTRGISALAGTDVPDAQSGFRLYSRRLIDIVGFPENRFEAESSVIVRAARQGFRFAFVDIELGFVDGRSTSHYRPITDSLRILESVVRARLERQSWVKKPSW